MTTVSEWKAAHPAMRFAVKALCLVIVVGFVAVALKPATPKAAPQSMLAKADRLDRVERPVLPPYDPNKSMPGYAPPRAQQFIPLQQPMAEETSLDIRLTPRGSRHTIVTPIGPGITMTRSNFYPKR